MITAGLGEGGRRGAMARRHRGSARDGMAARRRDGGSTATRRLGGAAAGTRPLGAGKRRGR